METGVHSQPSFISLLVLYSWWAPSSLHGLLILLNWSLIVLFVVYKYLDLNSKNLIRSVSMFYWFHENEMIWHIGMTFKLPPHISSCSLYSRSSDRNIQGTCLKYWYDMIWKKTNKKKRWIWQLQLLWYDHGGRSVKTHHSVALPNTLWLSIESTKIPQRPKVTLWPLGNLNSDYLQLM